ncbi:MAG TPA: hypothetical protein DCX54_12830 [Flavobacteriales bacterium]|nr:hypothetical protein [Flavobacteriales bacterium]
MSVNHVHRILIAFLILLGTNVHGQVRQVLFLGNSYTYVNNMPQIVVDFASSVGDSMVFESNTPGGYTLQGHASNPTSTGKIRQGNWDFVVLQEQSQLPSFPISQVEQDVFPFARQLDSLIDVFNPCSETIFYMTWGRKNGDASNCASWPPVCTYEGMDSLLRLRYIMMADSNDESISPVGAVWRYIRQNYPGINLYQADESHPSAAGSYAAACSFYTAIFKKDPTLSSYAYTLNSTDAASIRNAAKIVVFDSLDNWNLKDDYHSTGFTYSIITQYTYQFTNLSKNAHSQIWTFGDGTTDTSANPTHTYPGPGKYLVRLESIACDTLFSEEEIDINLVAVDMHYRKNDLRLIPNPAGNQIQISLINADSYLVSIYSLQGELLLNNQHVNGKTIDISSLDRGLYYVRIFLADSILSGRFIKE